MVMPITNKASILQGVGVATLLVTTAQILTAPSQPTIAAASNAVESAAKTKPVPKIGNSAIDWPSYFVGGAESLVARTVGAAEGTRDTNGGKTSAYKGHTDPGNGVWNLGSFSFQHCKEPAYNCSTAEEADQHQLNRLKGQAEKLRELAAAIGIEPSAEEWLNAIDLANQAPQAALGDTCNSGFFANLKAQKQKGAKGIDAIVTARVESFMCGAKLEAWTDWAGLAWDQLRRATAIDRARAAFVAERGGNGEKPVSYTVGQKNPYPFMSDDYLWWQLGMEDANSGKINALLKHPAYIRAIVGK